MRILPFIALVLILTSSCGYNRIRYTKAIVSNVPERSVSFEANLIEEQPIFLDDIGASEQTKINTEAESHAETQSIEALEVVRPESIPTDSVTGQEDLPIDVVYQARQAAKRASTAKVLFISRTLSIFVIAFFALILTGVGLWFYIKSFRARFITQEGEAQLQKAKIALIINVVVLVLIAALFAVLILLIF